MPAFHLDQDYGIQGADSGLMQPERASLHAIDAGRSSQDGCTYQTVNIKPGQLNLFGQLLLGSNDGDKLCFLGPGSFRLWLLSCALLVPFCTSSQDFTCPQQGKRNLNSSRLQHTQHTDTRLPIPTVDSCWWRYRPYQSFIALRQQSKIPHLPLRARRPPPPLHLHLEPPQFQAHGGSPLCGAPEPPPCQVSKSHWS